MLLRRCKYLIRKCHFQELSAHDPTGAMLYLQNDLASVINHDNEEEKKEVSTVNTETFVRVLFSQNFADAKFPKIKTLAKW